MHLIETHGPLGPALWASLSAHVHWWGLEYVNTQTSEIPAQKPLLLLMVRIHRTGAPGWLSC